MLPVNDKFAGKKNRHPGAGFFILVN
ncbi:inorganic pyrophosphatase [marine gamma proteobacterium HTCC2207]|uniref:Inorganic pyrophosphatase n=1 Tax=gamma proteobacterium HTCC2207 TaxID=314287 RepID=Q1YSR8_9GAMM|nr:inorganic pyrophosphatase [marine gamma proteobacterium HTCC2207] [gamma proteobacterium HTCC2207]